jgi:hypothetical protein
MPAVNRALTISVLTPLTKGIAALRPSDAEAPCRTSNSSVLILNMIIGAYQGWKSRRNVRRDGGL